MSKQKIKRLIIMGLGCLVLLTLAVTHSVFYNDSRWVVQMDLSQYVFSIKDTPMLVVGVLLAIYIVYLVATIAKARLQAKKTDDGAYTRNLSPYLGFLGFFGCFGFMGFWTYSIGGAIFPFFFFVFFGFFGFFFEGKLSHTLKDELYIENERKAELKAYKIGFSLMFLTLWVLGSNLLSQKIEWSAIFMIISFSLIFALVIFLGRYFLYQYEKNGLE